MCTAPASLDPQWYEPSHALLKPLYGKSEGSAAPHQDVIKIYSGAQNQKAAN